jgi:primosomal protein N' (replication factor Y)
MQKEALDAIQKKGGTILESAQKKLEGGLSRALRHLVNQGLVVRTLTLQAPQERRLSEQLLQLSPDSERVEAFLASSSRRKPAQALVAMVMQSSVSGAMTGAEIKATVGVTDATLRGLQEAGILVSPSEAAPPQIAAPTPNRSQQLAIDAIVDRVHRLEADTVLLFGVTGSGKTEVYLRAASEALKQGRQVLYLVPEIALAAEVVGRLRQRFGSGVALLHSDLSPGERLSAWLKIRNREASVILGARSALFCPADNLGLIIVDEEHETSYKQETAPRYHAKSVAQQLGKLHGCPVVLGSATPSLETLTEADQEKITFASLPSRATRSSLPTVHIQDLTQGYKSGKPDLLTDLLRDRLENCIQAGQQAILFLNRRAYSPFVLCRDCGHSLSCPNCAVTLSFHRRDGMLRCHHCGHQVRPSDQCPKCFGIRLKPFGVGTEQVEDTLRQRYPGVAIARLDRDIARRKGAIEEVLAGFRSREIQILVGTQMVAKGLDFPNVTLVGVIAADVSLNLPDFRASERTFQLLSQVAGRAGRGDHPGEVVIQTFNPDHVAIQTAENHDVRTMMDHLSKERAIAGYPPFRRLINVVLTSESREKVVVAADQVARALVPAKDAEILGPVDCVLERLNNRWRRHILIKLPTGASPVEVGKLLEPLHFPGVERMVDVDPYSLI